MKVGIIGLGLIGGSMALDLRASGFADEVLGFDQSELHANEAGRLKLVDRMASLEELARESHLVILATPVSVLPSLSQKILNLVSPHTTLTDVGSTKEKIAELISAHPKRAQFVLGHPMAGTEFSGPSAAISGLFENKAAVICDADDSGEAHVKKVRAMYGALRMRVIEMQSKMHDLHAAYVSHLSHISSFVLASTVLDKEKNVNAIFDLASGGFESTVRLAKSSPEMWAPIFEHNREFILEALEAYIERLKLFHQRIEARDFEATKKSMADANEIKRVLAQIQKKGKPHG